MGRMDRMQKMIASASGSLPKRPERNDENGPLGQERPERLFPSIVRPLGVETVAERRIFLILFTLPILLSSFVVQVV